MLGAIVAVRRHSITMHMLAVLLNILRSDLLMLNLQAFVSDRIAIQFFNGKSSRFGIIERNKSKSTATPSVLLDHDPNADQVSVRGKQLKHIKVCHIIGNVKDKKVASLGSVNNKDNGEKSDSEKIKYNEQLVVQKNPHPLFDAVVWIGGPGEQAGK